ncbi:MATE efflux family protein [Pleurostoma richardsiae]|uniref:MATE efflux family protein n=1 Tax=Pleurostoma richardsiae TaxID=41990 RepID=A0AA38VE47_9PEZI|nr:MATE efflux family protein [Pleurostoma richardsiae]
MPQHYISEQTPLLRPAHTGADDSRVLKTTPEVLRLGRATVPISASFALQNIVQAFSIMTAGGLGPLQLDVASYGFMFATCTGSMVAIGGATALDTLCGQSLLSVKTLADPTTLGRHLQQSLFVLSILFLVVITPLWLVSGRIFVALGQSSNFALGVGRFLILMLPAGYFQMVAESLKKFSQVQGDSSPVCWITFAAAILGSLSTVLLVRFTTLGIDGVPLAFFVYQFGTVTLLIALVSYRQKMKKTIRLISTWADLFDGLLSNLSLATTGILTIATEWWSFEILAIMAARLSPDEIGAQSILMSADLIFTTMSLGLGVATSHRIGQLLGANKPLLARRAAFAPYLLALVLGIVEFVIILAFRSRFGYMFTSDDGVVATTARVLPLMAGFQVLDLSNGGAGGILRGTRRNHQSGACNFVAYYGVGLTTAWMWCFRMGWGLGGLWMGIITGSGALLLLQTACVLALPWEKAAREASGEPCPEM